MSFKHFLVSFTKTGRNLGHGHAKQLSILHEYLKAHNLATEVSQDELFLPDIMQTWNFAAESNDDHLLALVPTVLTLLLKIISSNIQLRDSGLQLCKTLLLIPHLRILARGMSAIPSKPGIICACLQLLLEVVSFDGGVLAKRVYAERELSFRSLVRNLALRDAFIKDSIEDVQISVRGCAIRFLFANMVLQRAMNKADLLGHRSITSAWMKDIKDDPSEEVMQSLEIIHKHVVRDDALQRRAKTSLFTEWVLGRLATLYGYIPTDLAGQAASLVRERVHRLLLLVCTESKAGVLFPQNSVRADAAQDISSELNLRSDRADEIDVGDTTSRAGHGRSGPVRNLRLAAFALHLRPHSDSLQRDLLLNIFRAAPELLPDYFSQKRTFSFDPKITATWIGYCAFIHAVIQMPIAETYHRSRSTLSQPSATSIVIESILPQPLTQRVLARCLHQSSPLISLFVVRLLVAAFKKLAAALRVIGSDSDVPFYSRERMSSGLVNEFCRRCPKMKDVITLFRSTAEAQDLQREAITRLLTMYYDVTPQVAFDELFDISVSLSQVINGLASKAAESQAPAFQSLELEHLLRVAAGTPNMRWTHKAEHLELSPFATLLKLYVESDNSPLRQRVRALLEGVSAETQLLQAETTVPAVDALLASLQEAHQSGSAAGSYGFLDNAISRFIRRPVYYEDFLHSLPDPKAAGQTRPDSGPVSRILVALAEQWPHLCRLDTLNPSQKLAAAKTMAKFLGYCRSIGEDAASLACLRGLLVRGAQDAACEAVFKTALEDVELPPSTHSIAEAILDLPERGVDTALVHSSPQAEAGPDPFDEETPAPIPGTKSLFRWMNKDVQEAAEDGDLGELVMCLCADELSTRVQAWSALSKFVVRLEASSYIEKEMLALLIQETIHTAKDVIHQRPFPTFLGSFASRAILVEADPQHVLYAKLNKFLHAGPTWDLERVPLLRAILLSPPEKDDSTVAELEWFLGFVYQGLRTPEDVNVYRHGSVFERCLISYSSLHTPDRLKRRVLQIVGRATAVEGGSTTLLTRFGLLSWAQARLALDDPNTPLLRRLTARLCETGDRQRLLLWSGEDVSKPLDRFVVVR